MHTHDFSVCLCNSVITQKFQIILNGNCCNLQTNICSYMVVLYGYTLLHRGIITISLEKFCSYLCNFLPRLIYHIAMISSQIASPYTQFICLDFRECLAKFTRIVYLQCVHTSTKLKLPSANQA